MRTKHAISFAMTTRFTLLLLISCFPFLASAQRSAAPIVLAPDDVRAFPEAPAGFDEATPGKDIGRVELFQWDSSVTGARRTASVYLPPGYSAKRKYPVLYILHGLAGDHTEWPDSNHGYQIIGNLIAAKKAVPMIVVMPNGRALPDDHAPAQKDWYTPQNSEGFAKFERDLLDCLIPAIEAKYPVYKDRLHRGISGMSMGGGQTLNFGLGHLDTFAWLGAIAPAPNTKQPAVLVPDPAAARRQIKLLYLSCGNKDGLIRNAQAFHRYFKENDIPHIWHVDDHAHDMGEARNNIYNFVQRIFR
jgi:enterochelin esterase-like enzyme